MIGQFKRSFSLGNREFIVHGNDEVSIYRAGNLQKKLGRGEYIKELETNAIGNHLEDEIDEKDRILAFLSF